MLISPQCIRNKKHNKKHWFPGGGSKLASAPRAIFYFHNRLPSIVDNYPVVITFLIIQQQPIGAFERRIMNCTMI